MEFLQHILRLDLKHYPTATKNGRIIKKKFTVPI